MRVEQGDFSSPISQGINFEPGAGGGGIFDYYNPGPGYITELSIDTYLLSGLSYSITTPGDVLICGNEVQCNAGILNPFFEDCSVQYVVSTGEMSISFWGTGVSAFATWDGIAPLPAGCSGDPDGSGCTGTGHFYLTLNTGNPYLGNDSGGWNNNPSLFSSPSGPTFIATYSNVAGAMPQTITPEPAVFVLVGSSLIGLGFIARHRRRARAAISPAGSRTPAVSADPAAAPPA